MESGVALGLTAALCWGVADFLARGAVRSGGLLTMLFFMRLVGGLALLGVGFWLGILPARVPSPTLAAEAAGIGALLLLATVLYYRGLAIGTIALVSPIASSFAAITALLAIATGERPGEAQLAGMAVTLAGVALAAATPTRGSVLVGGANHDTTPGVPHDRPHAAKHATAFDVSPDSAPDAWPDPFPTASTTPARADTKAPRAGAKTTRGVWNLPAGVPEALAATALFGVGYFAIRYVIAGLGSAGAVLFMRGSDFALLGLFALIVPIAGAARKRFAPATVPRLDTPGGEARPPSGNSLHIPRWAFWCYLVPTAVLDTGANVAYNIGVRGSLIAVVSVLSSLFTAVTVLLAWALLRERLSRRQWLGVALILLGVALVSLPASRLGVAARADTVTVARDRFGGLSGADVPRRADWSGECGHSILM
ncbi:MAG TPA: DMT family transporter [Ktedonobacterales bacterium]